ncbi:MAG: hypothetical protein HY682_06885 [Chloroflexi bacterium]|nr:hypothetical protein [Chloroflexota bacterium]
MAERSDNGRIELEPVFRKAFMAPAVAEWARRLGKTLIVSTTEDDDTAAANSAVEVLLAVDGSVRGRVSYTLAPQTVLTVVAAVNPAAADAIDDDAMSAVTEFFQPIAAQAKNVLAGNGYECGVAVRRVTDVRGGSYAGLASSQAAVHMVTQPSRGDPASPEPLSLWFDLESASPAAAATTRTATAVEETPRRAPPPPAAPEARVAPQPVRPPEPSPAPAAPAAPAPAPNLQPRPAPPQGASGPASKETAVPLTTSVLRTGRLEIVDQNGTARAVVGTLADGSPHIVFADKDGRIRAAISLAKDGQPRILFLDEMGRRILDLPQAGSSSQHAVKQPRNPAGPAGAKPRPNQPGPSSNPPRPVNPGRRPGPPDRRARP